jgi:hypothetical protein
MYSSLALFVRFVFDMRYTLSHASLSIAKTQSVQPDRFISDMVNT